MTTRNMTLPTDSAARKEFPLLSGCLKYFPAALAGVSKVSKLGNDKHNPGQEMHHARGKSTDHGDCILRHLIDVQDLLASNSRGALTPLGIESLLIEASSLAWRALALSQELHEQFGAPLAPGAVEANNVTNGVAAEIEERILKISERDFDNELGFGIKAFKPYAPKEQS